MPACLAHGPVQLVRRSSGPGGSGGGTWWDSLYQDEEKSTEGDQVPITPGAVCGTGTQAPPSPTKSHQPRLSALGHAPLVQAAVEGMADHGPALPKADSPTPPDECHGVGAFVPRCEVGMPGSAERPATGSVTLTGTPGLARQTQPQNPKKAMIRVQQGSSPESRSPDLPLVAPRRFGLLAGLAANQKLSAIPRPQRLAHHQVVRCRS